MTQRPSTGAGIFDVKFRGERFLHELSVQDAVADYSGDVQETPKDPSGRHLLEGRAGISWARSASP